MKRILFLALIIVISIDAFSYEKRDILQKESQMTGLSEVLVKDFSELGFPDYKNRNFWNNLLQLACSKSDRLSGDYPFRRQKAGSLCCTEQCVTIAGNG